MRASAARALPPEVLPVAIDGVLRGDGDSHRVSYRVPISYFGFLWRPLVARRIEAAAAAGRPLPTALPWWAPARHAAFPPCPDSSSGRTVLAGCRSAKRRLTAWRSSRRSMRVERERCLSRSISALAARRVAGRGEAGAVSSASWRR